MQGIKLGEIIDNFDMLYILPLYRRQIMMRQMVRIEKNLNK